MILSRRQLIGSAVAASALSSLTTSIGVGASTVRPDACIVDTEMTGAAAVIASFASGPTVVHAFAGDPGGVWMNRLEPMLRRQPVTIAGYTSAPTLFCLQYLSRDYRIVLEAYADGPGSSLTFIDGKSDVADLIDSFSRNQRGPLTWLLAPRRG